MKIVEHTYPIVVLCVIYVISACRDLRKTNDLQDLALEEVNKSLLFLIESISKDNRYNNNSKKIEESEITKKSHIHKKKDDQHKVIREDHVHPDETKEKKSKPMNSGHRDDDATLIPINQYRKSFDAANRNKNRKKTKKEIWTKQKSRKAMASQDPEDKERYLIPSVFPSDQPSSVQSEYPSFYPTQAFDDDNTFNITEDVSDIHNDEKDLYHTSCVLTKAKIILPCDNYYGNSCIYWASNGYCVDPDEKDWMLEYCEKSCDTCLPPVSLLQNQIQLDETKNIISIFNLSLNVTTDDYANDTSWSFLSQGSGDIIFNSSESNATSQLANYDQYVIQYSCFISQNKEKKDNKSYDDEKTKSVCYDFEVHDSHGDGLCCEFGDGSFSLSVNTKNTKVSIEDEFEDGFMISTSFCINLDHGETENKELFITKEKPTHYPYKRWQCKNNVCICDSKPLLFSSFEGDNINDMRIQTFLSEVTMLSDLKLLQDVESAQYKAACWVLYDDPYEYDLADDSISLRMIQRYILAVFYFTTSPEKWENHHDFLSPLSECDWNYTYWNGLGGISCNEDDNVIEFYLGFENLDGTIAEELVGLKMLEKLDLSNNNIHGTIPSVLGRLSELRYLDLGSNNLEGTIPEMIGNLHKLIELNLGGNKLSGSMPDSIFTLKNLEELYLRDNKLSSSISPLIGKLNKLKDLRLDNNMLTGQIPSTIGSSSSFERVYLNNNRLSGPIPDSLLDLHSIEKLSLQDNSVTGSIPSEFCDNKFIQADCQNDVFDPDVSCDCCTCTDDSPRWDGECVDATMKILIDRSSIAFNEYSYTSDGLEWSITNTATQKSIPVIPLSPEDGDLGGIICVAYSDCISIDMISPPIFNTFYHIYLNDVLVDDDNRVFPGSLQQQGSTLRYKNEPFQFDEENYTLISCKALELEIACGYRKDTFKLEPDTIKRTIYNEVTRTSGRESIQDISSFQLKALCSLLQNEKYITTLEQINVDFLQRYVLLILHFMSPNGLFGDNEYLAEKHECDWNGITCRQNNETRIVTEISLSSAYNSIINGTLINEIGSLKYLEVLELNQTQLYGTIPRSYSNLWSLTKLNLSRNQLSGTMSKTLFHQLNNLEHIDLSDNSLIGSINDDIGSLSHIRSLFLSKNLFTGSLPLDRFKPTDLEHLDLSNNELDGLEFSLILNHKNLKTLDLSSNFFKSSIPEHTFTSLRHLEYFNMSRNDFSGTIPSTYTEHTNITHFDAHANRLQGTIPLGISALSKIQHINLQGNKLTGSLPSELNQLERLNILVLSHNELKGSIPFDPATLQNIERLHLQNNKLSGQAPIFSNMTSYITDCGFPSDSLDPVSCTSCNTCCNSDGLCQSKSSEKLSQVHASLIFMFTIITLIVICYALKDHITSNRYLESFFVNTVSYWNALMLISDKSVYHFLLLENKICWYVAFLCGIFQSLTLFLFVHSADIVNETSDREYTMLCPANSLNCEDSNKISSYGIFIFGLILTVWLLRDIVGSVKLMLVSFQKRDVDFFFTSGFVFSVTMLSLWSSIIYIQAIAVKNTDMIKDAVVLLFVVEIDERLFQLIESLNPEWVQKVDRNMRESLVYEGKDLVISSWMERYSASFRSMRLGIRGRNELPSTQQQNNMNEEMGEMEDKKDHVEVVDESSP